MSYFLLLVYILIICLIIYKSKFFKSESLPKYSPIIIFLLKFIAGIGVYIIYAFYYGDRYSSDIFKYFDDGIIIHSSIYENPIDYLRMITGIGGDSPHLDQYYKTCYFWIKPFNYGLFNDNLTVIRFNAIVRLFSMGNIHIHTLIMSFLSFIGLWSIFRLFENKFHKQKWLLVLVIFFIPSVYFWTSGILKEGILIFAFGLLLHSFNKLITEKFSLIIILGLVISIYILLISKFYVLIAALPGLFFILITKGKPTKKLFAKYILIHIIFLSIAWVTKPIIGVSFPEILAKKQHDFINYSNSLKQVGSKIEIQEIEPNIISIIKATPKALINTIFRPTIFEISNPMMLLAAIENLILLLFMVLTAIFFSKRNLKNPWLWFCVSFVLILFTLSGITTPILGALVRYKAPALPFFGLILMYLINFEKIEKLRKRLIPF